ncbi:phage tail assembly chaperone [Novosphingobium sp. NDB2Meth1]|uniref:phage tail assembly chaperone n=1 Tax=Novosphingobium sp. NDB2Meth1 TaxID=1892847 RepID=UPI000A74443C|nr:phage tail assembly chaperone [Novosphingobium sp. NDB2Meth1]
MGKFWSAEAGGFYDEDIHGAKLIPAPQSAREIKAGKRPKMVPNPDCLIPADAVAISDQTYGRLMDDQSAGLEIVDLGNGPLARTREQDPETRQTMRQRQRDRLLAASDWTQLGDTLVDQPELKSAWAAYRQALRDLDMEGEDWPTAPANS